MGPDTSPPVLMLGMEHHSAVGVMRSLGRWGIRVFGVDADPHAPALASRYCQGGFTWGIEAEPADASVQFLLEVGSRIGGHPILLATTDTSAMFVAQNAARLEQGFLFPKNSPGLLRALYDKREMHFLARRLGIPTPDVVFPQSRADVVEFAKTTCFPLVLKATDKVAASRRNCGATTIIVRSPDELLERYDAWKDTANSAPMLQEYIPGGVDVNWTFNGYFDEHSDYLIGITGKKLHQAPVYTGPIALGVCYPNPTVRDLAVRLVKATGYRGIIDVGFLYDVRNGTFKLHDVNPRLGSSFRLFVGTGGMDVVRAAYLHLTGRPVPPSEVSPGRKWVIEDAAPISSWRYLRDRAMSVPRVLKSYAGLREGAWFAPDDLVPFAHMCRRVSSRMVRRLMKRIRASRTPARVQTAMRNARDRGIKPRHSPQV